MVNTKWSDVENVGDHSGYVAEMVSVIKDGVREITGQGHLRERYIRSLCDRVVEWFGGKFIDAIITCRPICEAGAEQVVPRDTWLIVDVVGCVYYEAGIIGVACLEYRSSGSVVCIVHPLDSL